VMLPPCFCAEAGPANEAKEKTSEQTSARQLCAIRMSPSLRICHPTFSVLIF
jgi:hypothetical protein